MPTAKTTKAPKVKEPKAPKTSKTKSSASFEADIYNIEGKSVGKIPLPENIFGLNWNADLVHQVLVSEMSNKRSPIAHTKTRGEVSGGGKKPWRQKGTGRARHGSTRSPIWVGGGVAHGPRKDKNYTKKINRKMKTKALLTILAKKYKDREIIFLDNISFESSKTKYAKVFFKKLGNIRGLEKISTKKRNTAYIAMSKEEAGVKRSFDNFANVQVGDIRNINPLDVATYRYLIITNPNEAIKLFSSKVSERMSEESGKNSTE